MEQYNVSCYHQAIVQYIRLWLNYIMTQFMFGAVKLAPKAFSLYLYYFAYALYLWIQISYDGHVVVWIRIAQRYLVL